MNDKQSKYWRARESHLRAQKKYDDKNRDKKREYDKKRWQKMKRAQSNWNSLREWLEEEIPKQPTLPFKSVYEILDKMNELEKSSNKC